MKDFVEGICGLLLFILIVTGICAVFQPIKTADTLNEFYHHLTK
jgi:hypothetical protein